ncbi:unnamed protein product [Dicrocoelium dendriticum]|nr:unnamed protein product [Dicrocoelium dendriticum]
MWYPLLMIMLGATLCHADARFECTSEVRDEMDRCMNTAVSQSTRRCSIGRSVSSMEMNTQCLKCNSCKTSRNRCLIVALSKPAYSGCRHAQALLNTLRRTTRN